MQLVCFGVPDWRLFHKGTTNSSQGVYVMHARSGGASCQSMQKASENHQSSPSVPSSERALRDSRFENYVEKESTCLYDKDVSRQELAVKSDIVLRRWARGVSRSDTHWWIESTQRMFPISFLALLTSAGRTSQVLNKKKVQVENRKNLPSFPSFPRGDQPLNEFDNVERAIALPRTTSQAVARRQRTNCWEIPSSALFTRTPI